MEWIIYAIGVLVFSQLVYLFLRLAKEYKIGVDLQYFYLFLIPTFVFFFYNLLRGHSFIIDIKFMIIIIINAVIFTYYGNLISLKAINNAPNSGYSLMITKSNTILVYVLAVPLFAATLNLKSIFAIILILMFMSLILIERQASRVVKHKPWILYSLLAFFAFGFQSLVITYLGKNGVPATVTLFYLFLIGLILISFKLKTKKIKLKFDKPNLTIMLGVGLPVAIVNAFSTIGLIIAPNAGYITAVGAGSVAILTILNHFIFKDELNKQKLIGIMGVIIGLIILMI